MPLERSATVEDANCLSYRLMQNLQQTSAKLRSELRRRSLWSVGADCNGSDSALVLAAVCAGLFPNLAFRPVKGKLKVNHGRLEALPHPSSAASFLGGKDIWDSHGAAAATGDAWLCFNELSQVEEYYSLSGVSPAMSSVLLLLCGEGELRLRNLGQSAIGQSEDGKDGKDGDDEGSAVSGTTISRWWSAQLGVPAPEEEQVAVSLRECETWVEFRMQRETARRIQGLREMLRLLFRKFCSDITRFAEITAEGEVGATVLELVVQILRSEAITNKPPFAASSEQSEVSSASYSGRRLHKARGHQAPNQRPCDACGHRISTAMGCVDPDSSEWYCSHCWQAWLQTDSLGASAKLRRERTVLSEHFPYLLVQDFGWTWRILLDDDEIGYPIWEIFETLIKIYQDYLFTSTQVDFPDFGVGDPAWRSRITAANAARIIQVVCRSVSIRDPSVSHCWRFCMLLLSIYEASGRTIRLALARYAGVLCADLKWVSDRNSAGFVAGWLQSSNVFGRVLMSSVWGYIAARHGFDVVLTITLGSLFVGGLLQLA
eukprot:s1346_g6.t2